MLLLIHYVFHFILFFVRDFLIQVPYFRPLCQPTLLLFHHYNATKNDFIICSLKKNRCDTVLCACIALRGMSQGNRSICVRGNRAESSQIHCSRTYPEFLWLTHLSWETWQLLLAIQTAEKNVLCVVPGTYTLLGASCGAYMAEISSHLITSHKSILTDCTAHVYLIVGLGYIYFQHAQTWFVT